MSARTPAWKKLNKRLRAACKDYGLSNEARLDITERVTGQRSFGECSAVQLEKVLYRINSVYGKKTRSAAQGSPEHKKGAAQGTAKRAGYRANNISDNPAYSGPQNKIMAL